MSVPASTITGATQDRLVSAAKRRDLVLSLVERYGLVLLLGAVVLVFSLAKPDLYPTAANFRTILGNQSVIAIAALAAIVPLIAGHFDLSVGAVLGLCGIATGVAFSEFHLPIPAAIVVGVLIGALIGIGNGLLVTRFGVNSLIATLGTASLVAGAVQWKTGGQAIVTGIPSSFSDVGTGTWLGVPRSVYVTAVIALLVWYFLSHTPAGRYLHFVGSNQQAARLVGMRVDLLVVTSFAVSGLLAGAAGVLSVARAGVANPDSGPDFTLPALAAAFLGATTIRPGRYNVPGTLLAILFLAASVTGLTFVQVATWIQPMFNGAALIVGVAISSVVSRRRSGA